MIERELLRAALADRWRHDVDPYWQRIMHGDGWCATVLGIVNDLDARFGPQWQVVQIKQDCAVLHFGATYTGARDSSRAQEFYEYLRAAERRVDGTCEMCGSPARFVQSGISVAQRCQAHPI